MVDMFDTLGTLYGACSRGDMLDKDGNVPTANAATTGTAASDGVFTIYFKDMPADVIQ